MAVYPNQWINQPQYFGGLASDPNGYSPTSVTPINNQNKFSQMTNNIMVVPVSGVESAQSYPVAIGLTVLLLDYEHKIFWLKSNDGVSTKMTKHIFEIEQESNDNDSKNDKPEEVYVTKSDFDALSEKVNSLLKNLGES